MIEILLSTYNGEKYLDEQIRSIINQTYTNWILTIRDDGSTDKTTEIITKFTKEYPDKIKLLYAGVTKNIGVIHSFETLLAHSSADYVMFSDQDDIWLSEKVEKTLKKMREIESINPNTPIVVCCDLYVVNQGLKIVSESYWKYVKLRPELLLKNKKYFVTTNFVTGCTMLINKKAKEISLPIEKNAIMHDAWITLKTYSSKGIIFPIREKLIYYRQHTQNSIGAVEVEDSWSYFGRKLKNIKHVLTNNYRNFRMSKTITNISLPVFVFYRILYLLKR